MRMCWGKVLTCSMPSASFATCRMRMDRLNSIHPPPSTSLPRPLVFELTDGSFWDNARNVCSASSIERWISSQFCGVVPWIISETCRAGTVSEWKILKVESLPGLTGVIFGDPYLFNNLGYINTIPCRCKATLSELSTPYRIQFLLWAGPLFPSLFDVSTEITHGASRV